MPQGVKSVFVKQAQRVAMMVIPIAMAIAAKTTLVSKKRQEEVMNMDKMMVYGRKEITLGKYISKEGNIVVGDLVDDQKDIQFHESKIQPQQQAIPTANTIMRTRDTMKIMLKCFRQNSQRKGTFLEESSSSKSTYMNMRMSPKVITSWMVSRVYTLPVERQKRGRNKKIRMKPSLVLASAFWMYCDISLLNPASISLLLVLQMTQNGSKMYYRKKV